jgi:hypothetical protein
MTMGRIPYGSRKPIKPKPASMAVQAQPPSHFLYMRSSAVKQSDGLTRALPVSLSSSAKTFNMSSLSLSVLMWRCASWSRYLLSFGALMRLPL